MVPVQYDLTTGAVTAEEVWKNSRQLHMYWRKQDASLVDGVAGSWPDYSVSHPTHKSATL